VGLEDGLEGLLHISELADHKVENPEDVVKVGEKIEVKILRVDTDDRKIGLSRKRVEWAEDDLSDVQGDTPSAPTAKEKKSRGDLKGGLGGGGPLISPPTSDGE
jgi:small subunit ribosomal protein S1